MKLNMSHVLKGLIGLGICSVIMLLSTEPAQAVLEGNNRDRLEFLDFSENLIKDALYARKGRSTFNSEKRKYVRGIKRHNEAKIYEPDVYTWELAMNEHRKKIDALAKASEVSNTIVSPVPMTQDGILPTDPSSNTIEKKGKKNKKGRKSRKGKKNNKIEEKTIAQTTYQPSYQSEPIANSYYSASVPAVPALQPATQPAYYPQGKTGDSFDTNF